MVAGLPPQHLPDKIERATNMAFDLPTHSPPSLTTSGGGFGAREYAGAGLSGLGLLDIFFGDSFDWYSALF